eukprot:COSAG02_NODE_1441_length_12586_cov_484.135581_10_plen_68_part_00
MLRGLLQAGHWLPLTAWMDGWLTNLDEAKVQSTCGGAIRRRGKTAVQVGHPRTKAAGIGLVGIDDFV